MTEKRLFHISPLDSSKYGSYPVDHVVYELYFRENPRLVFDVPNSLKDLLSTYDLGDKDPTDYFMGISFSDDGTRHILNKYPDLEPDDNLTT